MMDEKTEGTGNQQGNTELVVTVTAKRDGQLLVEGFPPDHTLAMKIMGEAMRFVSSYFLNAGIEGRCNEHGQVIDQRLVEVKPPPLFFPGMQ